MVTRRDSKPLEPASPTTVHGSAGHVEVDARGNSVWRWTQESALDSTTILLKRLENDALAIESTTKLPQPKVAERAERPKQTRGLKSAQSSQRPRDGSHRPKDSGGGFDPYNNT